MPVALHIKQVEGKPGQVYYPLQLNQTTRPTPGRGEVVVRMRAAALNHRDVFIRQHLYPGIAFDNPMLADGYGQVVSVGPKVAGSLVGRAVILTPSRGWDAAPHGPEDPARYSVAGSTKLAAAQGTAQTFVVVPADEVEAAPPHLSPAEAAALPLVGLTAWRALVTKGGCGVETVAAGSWQETVKGAEGKNVLVTGIGGGVAQMAALLATAMGARVYVSSGGAEKLERAVKELGVAGGVVYKDEAWDKQLKALLPKERPWLDAVVDGAGGDVMARVVRLVRPGAAVVQYGMTAGPRMDWPMSAVMRNMELRGTTMGSRKEFRDMVAFVTERKVRPVVGTVVKGLADLEAIDALFEEMKLGKQFGKLVIEIGDEDGKPESEAEGAKL